MRNRLILYLAVFALLVTTASAASSTGPVQNQYCTDLFNNQVAGSSGPGGAIVTNAFTPGTGSIFQSVADLALLIVLMVLVVISAVYGIGRGFGINKLVDFAKTEYVESFFNLLMILVIIGGLATVGGFAAFFSNLANLGGVSQTGGIGTGNVKTLYTSICTNVLDGQILPLLGVFVGTLIIQPLYDIATSLVISVNFGPSIANYAPSFTITPLGGLALFYQLILFEESPVFIIVILGVATIFMFYVIYFLFPIFLYAGILFRSFPWTRAAGGSFLALFISFYIIFPALYFPFSALAVVPQTDATASNAGSFACTMAATSDIAADVIGFVAGNCQGQNLPTSQSTWAFLTQSILSKAWSFLNAVFSDFTGGGTPFINNLDVYVEVVAIAIGKLIGLGISFVISFDLLEALGDLLGSPSLQSNRLFERII
ncbi:MAG TPA: hypothetical protein VL945_00500 [Candidatus Saccharimonadales bacterium]|nr:hypothetical protein [Candidatus Saccharimonadales bacterium]